MVNSSPTRQQPDLESDNGGIFPNLERDDLVEDVEVTTDAVGIEDQSLANLIRSVIQTRVVPYLRRRQTDRIESGTLDTPDGFVLIL